MRAPITWARLVREGRKAMGWDLLQFAAATGLSKTLLCRIESGERIGTLPVVLRIADALKLDLNRLLPERADDDAEAP